MARELEQYIEGGAEPFPADTGEVGYRCSVDLTDGTHLPCVMIRRREPMIELVQRRLAEEKPRNGIFRDSTDPYREMLSHFVTTGNRIDADDVKNVTPSRYAIPMALLKRIKGETVMAWTGFVLGMNDGHKFAFGTSFRMSFFDLPFGYSFEGVDEVHNHSYIDQDGELRSIHDDVSAWRNAFGDCVIYREKPYFE